MQVFGEIFRELSPFLLAVFLLYGLGSLAMEAFQEVRKWRRPEPPQPPPEPRRYRVLVEDQDGWPIRTYHRLPADAVGRVLQEIERNKPA